MNFSWLIAWRTLFSSRERFVPFLALVSLIGIALGVASLIVVLSVMRGFQTELNRRWIGLNAHLTVSELDAQEKLGRFKEIASVQPFVEGEIIVKAEALGTPISLAAKLKGISSLEPHFLDRVVLTPKKIDSYSLMMGEELAQALGIHPDYPEKLTLIYPFGEIGPTGDFVPTQKTFLLSHVFRTGFYEWDNYRILVPFQQAKDLLGDQGRVKLQVMLHDFAKLERVAKKIRTLLPPGSKVESYAEQNARLFQALKLERLAMGSILFLFALITTFSVVGLLLLFIDAKRRDLAILRAMGLSVKGGGNLFLLLGGFLGGVGVLAGGLLGGVICWLLDRYPVRLPSTYYLDYLPVGISWPSVLLILIIAFTLVLASAWYPVRVASRLELLPMLREE